jgi:hypothetical protein
MALALSFVKHTVIPRLIAEQKKQQTKTVHEEEQH